MMQDAIINVMIVKRCFPKEKTERMDVAQETLPQSSKSSYQNLIEGNCPLVVKNKDTGDTVVVNELLLELYKEMYTLKGRLFKLEQLAQSLPQ